MVFPNLNFASRWSAEACRLHPCARRMAQSQTFPSFSYDSRAGCIQEPQNWPAIKVFPEERCLGARSRANRMDFRSPRYQKRLFQFHSLGRDCTALPAKRFYGITTSPLHASLPTDRLVAEWHLRSPRVLQTLAKKQTTRPPSEKAVRITIPNAIEELKSSNPAVAIQIQNDVREKFMKWFAKGYRATRIVQRDGGMDYILERGRTK